jgi:hypothetical protein
MAEEFPRLEPLEVRRLFVNGTAGNDVIEIQSVGGDADAYSVVVKARRGRAVRRTRLARTAHRRRARDGRR